MRKINVNDAQHARPPSIARSKKAPALFRLVLVRARAQHAGTRAPPLAKTRTSSEQNEGDLGLWSCVPKELSRERMRASARESERVREQSNKSHGC